MKKIGFLLLVLVLVFAFAACYGYNGNTDKKALIVVNFGSSPMENREAAINAIKQRLADEFSEYDIYDAYTSQIINEIYASGDDKDVDDVSEAIGNIYLDGYGEVLVVPICVIDGEEKNEMMEALEPFMDVFAKITISNISWYS